MKSNTVSAMFNGNDSCEAMAHCIDENGETLLVSLYRSDYKAHTKLTVSQFKGEEIVWQETVDIEELRALIYQRNPKLNPNCTDNPNPECADLDELNAAVARGEA